MKKFRLEIEKLFVLRYVKNLLPLKTVIAVLLIVLQALQLQASPSTSAEQTPVSISKEGVTVKEVLAEIEKQSHLRFFYNNNQVDVKRVVSVRFEKLPLKDAIKVIFSGTSVNYRISGDQILLWAFDVKAASTEEALNVTIDNSNQVTVDALLIPIKGKITDENGEGLPGANIIVKGTTTGTITDEKGEFQLEASPDAVLQITSIGYKTIEMTVGNQTSIDVKMEIDVTQLSEVVVVGYGTQTKASVTGAISSVKGSTLASVPVPNITNSIVGRVSGVIGRQAGGGQPGNDNSTIQIRGVSTRGNNDPLIVVDNVMRNNMNQVDPNSIESVTILKDAAATAPYGLGGANGVILITTKAGKSGAPTISLNSWMGTQTPTYYPEVLGPQDYMNLKNEALRNDNFKTPGYTPPLSQSYIDGYLDANAADPDRYPIATPKDIVNFHSLQQNHNIQVSGGTDKIRFYTNLGYFNQKGMFDQIKYTRYNISTRIDADVTAGTKFSISLQGTQEVSDNIDPDNSAYNLLRNTYKYIPTDPDLYSNGLWGASAGLSPRAPLNSGGYNKQNTSTLLTTISLEQKLPLKGLSIKGAFSYDPNQQNQKRWHRPYYYYNVNLATTPYTYSKVISNSEGPVAYTYLFQDARKSQWFTYQAFLNYKNTFGKHDVTGLVVGEARNNMTDNFNARMNNYSVPVDEFAFGSSNKNDLTIGGTSSKQAQVGLVYRVSDAIDGKYIIEASGRYDGHYHFAPEKRFAYFPAFSAGWVMSNENFMQSLTFLNYLKVRGSWGKSGNLPGQNFQTAPPFAYVDAYTLAGNAYAFGNGALVQGTSNTNQANPAITWETAIKTDVGFESTMFKGLLNLEVDFWKQKRSGMLFAPTTTTPSEYGIALSTLNIGEMESSGIDITAGSAYKLDNGLALSLNGTFSFANNKLTQIYEAQATYENPNRRRTGRPNNTAFGYHSTGLFQQSDDLNGDGIINAADGYNITQFGELHPGDIRYEDVSGPASSDFKPDGKIDINDEVVIGNTPQPLINYGFTLGANWKGFDLSAFFQGAAKSAVSTYGFLTVPFYVNNSNAGYEYFNNRWTPDTPGAKYPRANGAPVSNNSQASDFWIKDASYMRLRTFTLGYTIPSSVLSVLKIKSVRLYTTGTNLFTISKINWVDPELSNGGNGGLNAGGGSSAETLFPIQRTWTFGLNVNF